MRSVFPPIYFISSLIIGLVFCIGVFSVFNWATFTADDAHIMRVAAEYGWWDVYFYPQVYQQLSVAHFTPVEISIYQLILGVGGVEPSMFLVFQIFSILMLVFLVAVFVFRLTNNGVAAFLAVCLILSCTTLPTLITRFYTVHYVVGGVFTLAALVMVVGANKWVIAKWFLASGFVLLALFSKEIYLATPLVIGLIALNNKNFGLFWLQLTVLLIYFSLRLHMLGFSVEGRGGEGYLVELARVSPEQWWGFIVWYADNKLVLLVFSLLAFVTQPKSFLKKALLALLFVAPGLAAPHGIVAPDLHADRIFFAFDCALAIVVAVTLHSSLHVRSLWMIFLVLVLVAMMQYRAAVNLRDREISKPDYIVTQDILAWRKSGSSKLSMFVPLDFQQGELQAVIGLVEGKEVFLLQNCVEALKLPEKSLVVYYGHAAKRMTRNELAKECREAFVPVEVVLNPAFNNGILSWDFTAPLPYSGGVLFVDRALAVPLTRFSERLVRPKPGERFQLYVKHGEEWWFSEVAEVGVYPPWKDYLQ